VVGEPVIGIQIEGTAEVKEPSVAHQAIVERYASRFKRDEEWVKDFIAGNTEHRLYKLTPSTIYLFDEKYFPGGERQKIL
jgi:hypothetical protein